MTITLSATPASGSTIANTYYTVDGGAQLTYSGPFTVNGDGDHTVRYWSVDSGGVYEAPNTLSLRIAGLRIVTSSPLPSGTIGAAYSATLEAAGGVAPYTWSIASGSLPPGLALNPATGEISGTPTAAGTFSFDIRVTDSSGTSVEGSFGLAPPPPSGTAGDHYEVPVVITPPSSGGGGGDPTPPTCSTYAVVAGTLPPGLSLDANTGILSGTPEDGGIYTFTIGCQASTGQSVTKEFTITIYNPAPMLTSLSPAAIDAEEAAFILTLNGSSFVRSSVVRWNGDDRPTTYISANQLAAEISAADNATPGSAEVTVYNPAPGDALSNALTFTIREPNLPPEVDAGGPYTVDEGASITLNAIGSDPDADLLSYAWDLDNDGAFEIAGQAVSFSVAAIDGPAERLVTVEVRDPKGLRDTATATVFVANVAPTAAIAAEPATIDEGQSALITLADAADPSAADTAVGFSYDFDCTDDGVWEVAGSTTASYSCVYAEDGYYTARARISDKDGAANTYTVGVSVMNLAPVVEPIIATLDPVAVGTVVVATAGFSDAGVLDTHTAEWDWGDGTTSASSVSFADGAGAVTGSYAYSTPGVYTIKLTVTDDEGGVGESFFRYVVVYDPDGGFVTGGGWIPSPAGACQLTPSCATQTGKANFGFVAKYRKGANVPIGNTEFQFRAGNLNFNSTSYDWLVVAGAQAKYKGVGTINGQGSYGFMLSATDGQVNGGGGSDKFRIKIWDLATGAVVYDNQMGAADDADPTTTLGGGSIVIHK